MNQNIRYEFTTLGKCAPHADRLSKLTLGLRLGVMSDYIAMAMMEPTTYSHRQKRNEMRKSRVVLAWDDETGQIIGWGLIRSNDEYGVINVFVHRKFRNRGIGSEIFRLCIHRVKCGRKKPQLHKTGPKMRHLAKTKFTECSWA